MAGYEHFEIRGGRLLVDGAPISMYSGSYQYWRVEPRLWGDILEKVKGMGFSMIETYMPWSVHETAPGVFDFGEGDPSRDVGRFLDACASHGVRVLARPGPHINAEMTYFGYPERLFADEDLLMRTALGAPAILPAPPAMFPCPCYHHPRFLSEVDTYFKALAEHVAPRLYPEGSVIAIQVDNECAKFGRAHPFDTDYSEYSVLLYRRWLEEKYGGVEALNERYHSGYPSFDLVDPPRKFDCGSKERLPYYLDWIAFGEHYVLESLRSVGGLLRDSFGDGVPFFHNYPVTRPMSPLDMPGAEAFLDWQGVDAYPTREQYHTLRRGMKYTSAVSRLPHLAEFCSGSIYYSFPLSLADQALTTWTAVMHGIRGINFYMIVERERWYGSPVKNDGTEREDRYTFYTEFLSDVKRLGLEDMVPRRDVLLLSIRDYERLLAGSILPTVNSTIVGEFGGGAAPDLWASREKFGLSESVATRYARLCSFWYWTLTSVGAHFALGDSECGPGAFDPYRLVIAPTFEFMDATLQEKLLSYVRGGGTLLVGPRAPEVDSAMKPCALLAESMKQATSRAPKDSSAFGVEVEEVLRFEGQDTEGKGAMIYTVPVGSGKLVHLGLLPGRVASPGEAAPFAALVDTLVRSAGIEPCYVPADPRVDVSILEGAGSSVVFVANPTPDLIETKLELCGPGGLSDARTGESLGGGASIPIEVEPWSIRLLRGGS